MEGVGITATVTKSIISGAAASEADKVRPADTAAPIGVVVLSGARVTINRMSLVDNSREGGGGAAIFLHGGATGSVISLNNIDRNDLGIGVEGTSGAKIYNNGLLENDTGISLGSTEASDSNTILNNRIEKGGLGLFLGHASSNAVSSNALLANTGKGAELSSNTAKNKMYRNRSQNNGGLGFDDSSPATGRLPTANIYTSNVCTGTTAGATSRHPQGSASSPPRRHPSEVGRQPVGDGISRAPRAEIPHALRRDEASHSSRANRGV